MLGSKILVDLEIEETKGEQAQHHFLVICLVHLLHLVHVVNLLLIHRHRVLSNIVALGDPLVTSILCACLSIRWEIVSLGSSYRRQIDVGKWAETADSI